MKLDSKNLVRKMEKSLGKILPPDHSIDVLVKSKSFTVTQPPFYISPIFQESDKYLEAASIAALMQEAISTSGVAASVRFAIEKKNYKISFLLQGDTMTFITSDGRVKEEDAQVIPNLLKNIKT